MDPSGEAAFRADARKAIRRDAIPRLQVFSSGRNATSQTFLSECWPPGRTSWEGGGDTLHLLPGVPEVLLELGPLIRVAIRQRWLQFVYAKNPACFDEQRLERLLFRPGRVPLLRARDGLVQAFGRHCAYGQRASRSLQVDHFVPWSTSGDDALDNLILACDQCNNDERAALAGTSPLEVWSMRSKDHDEVPLRTLHRSLPSCYTTSRDPNSPSGAAGASRPSPSPRLRYCRSCARKGAARRAAPKKSARACLVWQAATSERRLGSARASRSLLVASRPATTTPRRAPRTCTAARPRVRGTDALRPGVRPGDPQTQVAGRGAVGDHAISRTGTAPAVRRRLDRQHTPVLCLRGHGPRPLAQQGNASLLAGATMVYLYGVTKGRYLAEFPVYIARDRPDDLRVDLVFGSPGGDGVFVEIDGRSYGVRETRVRLHQHGFRTRVVEAYGSRCAMCDLRHASLLDAAHIVPDGMPNGLPVTPNGLSLCKIHHAAYDQRFVGIRTDHVIEVDEELLHEVDGPMLKHGIQELHGQSLRSVPRRVVDRPDLERLDWRYTLFRAGRG